MIGIGVNVLVPNTPPPEELRERPGSLRAAGARFADLGSALDAVLHGLEQEWRAFELDGVPALAHRLNAHDGLSGHRVELAVQRVVGIAAVDDVEPAGLAHRPPLRPLGPGAGRDPRVDGDAAEDLEGDMGLGGAVGRALPEGPGHPR